MLLTKKQYKRAVWKNGLGFTDEIAIFPPNANLAKGDFLWRISSAQIERGSPFSVFPDHDRVLVILKGEGIRLTHTFVEGEAEESVDLPPHEVYEFPGDVPSRCELLGGAVADLSVFVRKAEVEAQVQIVSLNPDEEFVWHPEGRWAFAFAALGDFETNEGILNEGDSLQAVELDAEAHSIRAQQAHSKLILIHLNAHQ